MRIFKSWLYFKPYLSKAFDGTYLAGPFLAYLTTPWCFVSTPFQYRVWGCTRVSANRGSVRDFTQVVPRNTSLGSFEFFLWVCHIWVTFLSSTHKVDSNQIKMIDFRKTIIFFRFEDTLFALTLEISSKCDEPMDTTFSKLFFSKQTNNHPPNPTSLENLVFPSEFLALLNAVHPYHNGELRPLSPLGFRLLPRY